MKKSSSQSLRLFEKVRRSEIITMNGEKAKKEEKNK